MDKDKIKEILNRIPISAIVGIFLAYQGYDYMYFTSDPASPLLQKQAQSETLKKENGDLAKKLKAANEFFKSLESKRQELRKLAGQLDELKGTISTTIDVPAFMKMAVTEAKKVGLTVIGIKPSAPTMKDYYEEQPFAFAFRGVYVQLLVYLERLANVQNIVRVDNFDIRPLGAANSQYVELEGSLQIKTFRYVGTKADDIASGKPAAAGSQGGTGTKPGGAAGGGH